MDLSRDLLRDLRPLGVLDLLLDLLLLLDQLRERDLLYFGDLIAKTEKQNVDVVIMLKTALHNSIRYLQEIVG